MGTLVHVQLYTFSFRKAEIRPRNMPKTADWVTSVKIMVLKNGPTGPTKVYLAWAIYNIQPTIGKMGLSRQVWSHGSSIKKNDKTAKITALHKLTTHICYAYTGCPRKNTLIKFLD